MQKKGFSTPSYMLLKPTGEVFGYVRGEVILPDYEVGINIHFTKDKAIQDKDLFIDGFDSWNFDLSELETISKGVEVIKNQVQTQLSESLKNLKSPYF